jgi:arylsulfatase A-like enzyme
LIHRDIDSSRTTQATFIMRKYSVDSSNRRDFLKQASATALLAGYPAAGNAQSAHSQLAALTAPKSKPNIVLYLADELRADFIGASRENFYGKTPNIDKLAERGAIFTHAVTNQPLCSPARSCLFTGRYATETGVWKLEVNMRQDLPTMATELRSAGYTANLFGKWHLAEANVKSGKGFGWVAPEYRGGFLDAWEGANVLERTSHPYYGSIWDKDGNEIRFQDEYRVDFMTDRVVRFLKQPQEKPFLLFISQLEPHFQNDLDTVVGPKGEAEKHKNPFVPADLRPLPGVWQQQLPDYYAAVESIDASVGRVVQTLEEQKLLDNTILILISDHGCHFKTREDNYKRTPHDSSIRIPLVMAGPGIPAGRRIDSIAGIINLTPTVLEMCGVEVPSSMKGRSLVPLIAGSEGELAWKNRELIQFSQSNGDGIGRAIRTGEWTYSIANPTGGSEVPYADTYTEYVMFNNTADPAQLVNLAGRVAYKEKAAELRAELEELIAFSGDPKPEILPAQLLYP